MLFKRSISLLSATLCGSFFATNPASAVVTKKLVVTEDFTKGSNEGQWNFLFPAQLVDDVNASYLYVSGLDTFAPQLQTGDSGKSIFTGNYVQKKVKSIQFTNQVFSDLNPNDDRPVTLMLISGDLAAYKKSDKLLIQSLKKWETFSFDIPKTAQEASAAGWKTTSWPRMDRDHAHGNYDDIIRNVDHVEFYYGDPELFYIFQDWSVGATGMGMIQEM